MTKLAVGAGVAWTAPVLLSTSAVAQGSGACPIELTFQGLFCFQDSSGAGWIVNNTTGSEVWVRISFEGCGLSIPGTPESIPPNGSINRGATQSPPPQAPCDLTITVEALDGPSGSTICTLGDTTTVDCS